MPPRIRTTPARVATLPRRKSSLLQTQHQYATVAAITPAASHEQMTQASRPLARYPSTQPSSYKPPELRKSQLLRQYASLLRSSPLMLIFQHNNIKANEWVAIRRELTIALRKVDAARAEQGHDDNIADTIKLQIIQSSVFGAALKVVEFYKPGSQVPSSSHPPTDPSTSSSATLPAQSHSLTHTLSAAAHEAVEKLRRKHALKPLLSGPLAILAFPDVEPQYLKAALTILAPQVPDFPAPKRKANPGWHDPAVQTGLQKLLLLGARVEGRVFDTTKTRWVGAIGGGMDGLRGRLVAMVQGVPAGVTNTLESAGKSLYLTVEGRKMMLEDEQKENAGDEVKKEEKTE